jgi:hypothetical protein
MGIPGGWGRWTRLLSGVPMWFSNERSLGG